ncbi:unnamed protein product [Parascedosporium putredinis]|uniref:Major facilitator superfamily (MFS) profile domain-containing protein n=1 Tax=Parascedosporium putredinis TaxID=1442378 RepID=A0A9P1MGB3_9PEZI|nr:unnamed protein product [Parascedosporium putredinis]CAI8005095.1 unnamed protein product [Parascedosporium putredinis]
MYIGSYSQLTFGSTEVFFIFDDVFEIPLDLSTLKVNKPVRFKLHVDRELLQVTKQKLALTRYPEEQTDFGPDNWSQGAKVHKVKELAEYWRDVYDWAKHEERLNDTFDHYLVKLHVPDYGHLVLHFTHAISERPNAIPMLFSHGWPGSFVEAEKVVGKLSNPENLTDQAFHFVAPSIPGFGFSPAPARSGVGPTLVARAYKILMTDVLDFEREALRVRRNFEVDQSGYLEQQKTRPQTLGFALGDSPLGLLAWFVEKFHDWGDVHETFTHDDIITLVMMHWVQGATPGLRFYREAFGKGIRDADKTFETYVACPTGVSMYAKEQLHCPKDWAQQVANIQYWKELYHYVFVSERLGRRKSIWLGMVLVIVGAILQTSAFTVPHLIIGRIITGFGTGMKTSTVPMYQSELCDRKARGRLVSREVLFVGVGITIAYWFDFGMSFVGGPIAWRLPIAFQMVFALVVIALVFALPESPRWLFAHGRQEEAIDVLCRVYDLEPTDEYISEERDAILVAIQDESETIKNSPLSIFKNDKFRTRYRVLLAGGIQFMNQAGGINLVVYYIPSVLVLNLGTAIGVGSNWLWNFTVVMITPVLINRLEWKAYFVFMATNAIFVPLIYFFYPETSNVRLEDIDSFFTSGRNPVAVAREFSNKAKKGGGVDPEAPSFRG